MDVTATTVMVEDTQSKCCQFESTINYSKVCNQAETPASDCGGPCHNDNPASSRLELAGNRKYIDNQTNSQTKGAGPHLQTDNQTLTNGSNEVKSSTSPVQNVQLDNVSFNIERDSHLCKTDVNVDGFRKFTSENKYCCGACSRRFKTICHLHDHLKASHQSGGSYHFNHYLNTAFPKYDSCCQFTQTGSENSGKDGKISFDNRQSYESTTKQDATNFVIHLPDRVNTTKSKSFLELSGASQTVNEQSEICSVSTQGLELVKTEQELKDNVGISQDADYNSDGTDDYFDNDIEAEESAIDTKYHIETETVENNQTSVSSSVTEEKTENVKSRKRKQSTPKSIKTDKDDISDGMKEVIKPGGKKSVVKIETGKLPACKQLEDPIPDGNCECDICGAKFSFKRGLLRHEQMKHLDSMKHKCQFCEQKFMREFNLQKHIKCVHTIGQGQKYKEKYRARKKVEKEKEKNVCVAKPQVKPKAELKTDLDEMDVKVKKVCKKKEDNSSNKAPHTCNICGHTMPKSKMDVHQRLHSGERPFICHVCGKGLISQNKLKRHMLIHSEVKKHTCDTCGAGFQMKYKLRMHQHIHTGKKPYLCSICGAEFNHSSNLATHTRCVHLQIKPFECPTCGGRYAKRSQLDDHILSHSTEKQYTCRYCGKSFKYYKGMRRHEKNHYEEKSFKCDQCDCRFARRDNLERHKLSHQEPSLECKTCKKKFRDKRLLRDHEYSHTGVKQYQCVLCGEGYKAANQYYTHMLAAHGMDKEQAKLMHVERQTKVTVLQSMGKHSTVQVDPNQPLRLDAEPNQDPEKTTSKTVSPSVNVSQMVTGIMEENRAAINVLTRVATQNLRLHSEDIQEEEKLNVIVPPLNPMILLERNQGFSSLTGANNMNVSVENTGSTSSTSFVMLTPLSQSRDGLQIQQTGNLVSGNLQIPQRQSINGQLDDNLRHPAEGRTTNFGSLQMAVNHDNGSMTPDSVQSAYSIQDARMTLESLARQHETSVSVPLTLMRLSENMMDPPTQRQGQETQEQTNQQAGSGAYRIQNMF